MIKKKYKKLRKKLRFLRRNKKMISCCCTFIPVAIVTEASMIHIVSHFIMVAVL